MGQPNLQHTRPPIDRHVSQYQIHVYQALTKIPFPMARSAMCSLMAIGLMLMVSLFSWQVGSNYIIDLGVKNFDTKREAYFAGAVSPNGTQAWMVDSGASFGLCCDVDSFTKLNFDEPRNIIGTQEGLH